MEQALERWFSFLAGADGEKRERLRETFSSQRDLFCHREKLAEFISPSKREAVDIALDAWRVAMLKEWRKRRIRISEDYVSFLIYRLTLERHPAAAALFLDDQGRLLQEAILSRGRTMTMMNLAERIVYGARAAGASGIVLGHSYCPVIPSNLVPSVADANNVFQFLKPYPFKLLDYVLVGKETGLSVLRELGE